MNRNERFVITINRQFGTGGHEIGMEIARRLGIKLIDRQILKAIAEKFNITEDEASKIEEQRTSWWDDFAQFYQGFVTKNEYAATASDITPRRLFAAQSLAMRQIAAQESCVIIGRCAFDVFRETPNALKIFLYSSMKHRIARVIKKYNVSESDALEMIMDNDYMRETYTKTFTGRDWYDCRNYDIALDIGKFGVNGAVDFLLKFIDE